MKSLGKILLVLLSLVFLSHSDPALAQEEAPILPTPAELINAVNSLRLSYGVAPLAVHPVLMQIAQQEANGIASGMSGYWRPNNLTLGQWMMSLGYPLSGDLSQDGYRSENWILASTTQEAIDEWLLDDLHKNTMLSLDRSHIGAGVATSGDEIYLVLETALQTNSGRMQFNAYPTLTALAGSIQNPNSPAGVGDSSQYILPVAINTARPDGDVIHEVKHGQTLWRLADQYKVSVEQIKRLNGLTDDTILAGWKLLIQKAATQPAPATATVATFDATRTPYPTSVPFHTPTATTTVPVVSVQADQFVKQNSTVVVALLISFSILVAGLTGFKGKNA
jgi:LysM repeat protein